MKQIAPTLLNISYFTYLYTHCMPHMQAVTWGYPHRQFVRPQAPPACGDGMQQHCSTLSSCACNADQTPTKQKQPPPPHQLSRTKYVIMPDLLGQSSYLKPRGSCQAWTHFAYVSSCPHSLTPSTTKTGACSWHRCATTYVDGGYWPTAHAAPTHQHSHSSRSIPNLTCQCQGNRLLN